MNAAQNKIIVSNALSIIGVVMVGSVIYVLHSGEVHPSSRDIVMVCVGVLASTYKEIFGYWLGSSAEGEKPKQ